MKCFIDKFYLLAVFSIKSTSSASSKCDDIIEDCFFLFHVPNEKTLA